MPTSPVSVTITPTVSPSITFYRGRRVHQYSTGRRGTVVSEGLVSTVSVWVTFDGDATVLVPFVDLTTIEAID